MKQTLEGAEVGTWDWDLMTNEMSWSQQQERLFGLHPNSFGGTSEAFLALVAPEDRVSLHQALHKSLQSREAFFAEFRVPLADGSVRWLGHRGQVFANSHEELTHIAGITFDITAQKLTEAKLVQQIKQERLIAKISQGISRSNKLRDILQQTVREVRAFLGVDRLVIIDLHDLIAGEVTYEDHSSTVQSMLTWKLRQTWLVNEQSLQVYRQGHSVAIADIRNQNHNKTEQHFLEDFCIQAYLTTPLLENHELWGLLSAHHSQPKNWQPQDWRLLETLSTQVSTAIQRDRLHQGLTQANQELKRLAYLDGLTQVANRLRFEQFLPQEWRRLVREQESLALIMADIDYFKAYNDVYGHLAGDDCLRLIAQIIRDAVQRPADMVARYGGEEFVVVLPKTDLTGAQAVAEKIRLLVHDQHIPHKKSGLEHIVTLSLGVAVMSPQPLQSPEVLIKRADQALYQAKEMGRDRVVVA
ncbi:MAG: diguanylate cyclase [Cyanobacteria bacterium P01_F01_bin.86]